MKTAEPKTSSHTAHLQTKTNQAFFAKQSQGDFFSKGLEASPHFFRSSAIQRKLTIGEPNDKYEKEADTMADKVVQRLAEPGVISKKEMNVQAKPISSTITQLVQAKCASCEEEEKLQKKDEDDHDQLGERIQKKPIFESNAEPPDDDNNIQRKCQACEREEKVQKKADGADSKGTLSPMENTLNSSKAGGIPMPSAEKQQMENSFGTDFSNVRLHTDNTSVEMNRSLHAQAFTHGSDIYFNAGKYNPHSVSSQHLLAHELTHVVQQTGRQSLSGINLQRSPKPKPPADSKATKTPAPVPGGNILYIGMNNFKPEIDRLKEKYKGSSVEVTGITRTENEKKTVVGKNTYNLQDPAGVHDFAAGLTKDASKIKAIEGLFTGLYDPYKDDTAHVIAVYAAVEDDGKDRMTRVILSGHSAGDKIFHEDVKGAVEFSTLVSLKGIFPKAAAQTKHVLILACYTSAEDNLKKFFVAAYPNVQTIWGYTDACPSGSGAVKHLNKWTDITDLDPTTLPIPESGQANWAVGAYQTGNYVDPVELLKSIRADEAKFNEYFDGTKVDANAYTSFLHDYYGRARNAAQRTSDIKGADHDYVELHANQSFRLRFWPSMIANFWKEKGPDIKKGYGSAKVPNYDKLSRKETLTAIANFNSVANGDAKDKTEAQRLLNGVRDLDPSILQERWIH